MADKKPKPERAGRKAEKPAADRQISMAAQQDAEMRRLLHEAAWSRMFGRTGEKNPFSR